MAAEVAAEIREVSWDEIDDSWEALIADNFHPAYAGVSEVFGGIETARDKLKSVLRYRFDERVRVWAAFADGEVVGVLVGPVVDGVLTILDLAVAASMRRLGLAKRMFLAAMRSTGTHTVRAEIRDDNTASLQLALGLGFEIKMTVHLLEWTADS